MLQAVGLRLVVAVGAVDPRLVGGPRARHDLHDGGAVVVLIALGGFFRREAAGGEALLRARGEAAGLRHDGDAVVGKLAKVLPAVAFEQKVAALDDHDGLADRRDVGHDLAARAIVDRPADVLAGCERRELRGQRFEVVGLRTIGRERLSLGVEFGGEFLRCALEAFEAEALYGHDAGGASHEREAFEEERERCLARVGRGDEVDDGAAAEPVAECRQAAQQRLEELLDGVVTVGELARGSIDVEAAGAPLFCRHGAISFRYPYL